MLLRNKTAIVTGGASGIGEGIVKKFIEEGAEVVIADINEKRGEKLEKETKLGKVKFILTNVSKKQEVKRMVEETISLFNKIDVLINCAGIAKPGLLINIKEDDWDEVINVNLKGCFLCSQAVARNMIDLKTRGKIINISSTHARLSFLGSGSYVASKGGIEALTKTMARELGQYKINVNAVEPGSIATPLTMPYYSQKFKNTMLERIIFNEFGSPEMVADVVCFLASEKSYYITGQTIVVDGGFSIDGYPVHSYWGKLD